MKLRKTISKILALGTGAVMVGATILSATAAADLKDYPSPFVKDGKFNAVLVVGDSAASSDVIGSVDIATSLQFASRVKKTITSSGGGQVSVSGDAWRVGAGAKKLEFSETLDAGTSSLKQETVRNVTTFIGKDELPGILATGTFSNTQGDYDYRQYIYFDSNPAQTSPGASMSVIYAEDPSTSKTADYFYVKNGDVVGRYSLEFTSAAKSDVTDSSGSASATGTYLWNFEGKKLKMLGKEWSILKARTDSTTHAEVDLTLMGGAVRDVLNEGDSKTYTINGKDFEVTLDFVGSTTTKLTINGEVTDSLQKGTTQTLKDGTQIGVRDILAQEFAGGTRKTEFYLGADKVRLRDTRTDSASASGEQTLEVGTNTITGTSVAIAGSNASTSYTLSSIAINVTADNDVYAAAGKKVSESVRRPQAFLSAWDIRYDGLEPTPTELIKLSPSGSTQYYLEFADGAGNNARLPLVYTSGTTQLKLGNSNDDLVLMENQSITKNDYFIVSDTTQRQGTRPTYALRYISALKSTETSPQIEFQDIGSGSRVLVDYKAAAGEPGASGSEDATLKLAGGTYRIWNSTADTSINFPLRIDLDGSSSLGPASNTTTTATGTLLMNITTKGGAQILMQYNPAYFTNSSPVADGSVPSTVDMAAGSVIFSVQTVDTKDYDNVVPSQVEFNISAASGKVDLSEQTALSNLKYVTPSSDSNEKQAFTSLGAYVDWSTVSNDPDKLVITYPVKGQRLPIVTVTAPGGSVTKTAASEAGQLVYYETNPITVDTAKLASEVADVTAQNAIVVGGPCANAAAFKLMRDANLISDDPNKCAQTFTEGKAMLKLFENGENVALLVAGASAMDTRRAARVLSEYSKWQDKGVLKGIQVEVAGTSFSDITVSAPQVVVAPVVPVVPPANST